VTLEAVLTDGPPADASGVKIFPPGVYLAALLVGFILEWLLPFPIAPAAIAPAVRILGVIGLVLGALLILAAGALFRRMGTALSPFEPTSVLATEGPYRFSRNPIYLGLTLVLAGFALVGNALWPLIAVVPAVWVVHTQVILREEAYLESRFGAAYRDFRGRVRRWL